MVNIRLAGGLGNQLFQLAAGLRFASYDPSIIRVYKRSLAKYEVPRDYELEKLIDFEFNQVSMLSGLLLKYRAPKVIKSQGCINDNNYKNSSASKNQYLDGYFQYDQSWGLIKPAVSWIQEHMRGGLRSSKKSGLIVHARGGDFLKNKLSLEHELNHFNLAINKIKDMPQRKILVCSDEAHAHQVYKFFLNRGLELDYKPSHDDDWLQSFLDILNSDLLIGGRSTFAWWASALGNVESYLPCDFEIGRPRLLHHPFER